MLGSVTPKTVLPPDSGKEFVESISGYLKDSDIVFGNLEGAIITDSLEPVKCKEKSRKAKTCYEFGMPENLAASLPQIGFNVINMDNNHSEDYGDEGYEFTKRKLDSLGITPVGKKEYAVISVNNDPVCIAAFGYSGNSFSISDLENAKNVIQNLNKYYNIIIVSFHGGAEGKDAVHVVDSTETYLGENRGNEIAFAHTVIDAGADLVIGHGPHVLRAFEIYKNKLITYSLGNFLTYGNINISGVTGISGILDVDLDSTDGNFLRGKFISTKQVDRGIPVYDKNNEGYKFIQELSYSDIENSKICFSSTGYFFDKYFSDLQTKPVYIINLTSSMFVSK
jgi:Bacterial capsule synthesis protein PGA_cap